MSLVNHGEEKKKDDARSLAISEKQYGQYTLKTEQSLAKSRVKT